MNKSYGTKFSVVRSHFCIAMDRYSAGVATCSSPHRLLREHVRSLPAISGKIVVDATTNILSQYSSWLVHLTRNLVNHTKMCSDLGSGSRCCAFYSATGFIFTVRSIYYSILILYIFVCVTIGVYHHKLIVFQRECIVLTGCPKIHRLLLNLCWQNADICSVFFFRNWLTFIF